MSFWVATAVLGWTWCGYALALWLATRWRRARPTAARTPADPWPLLSVIIAAHNEEAVIADRLRNCLDTDYPEERREIIVVSDHSTDATNQIVRSFGSAGVRLILATQRGKSPAQNEAVGQARGELLLFSDADTVFDRQCLKQMAAAFADRLVGGVAGNLAWTNSGASAVAGGGSLYWRYEHLLWRLEHELGILPTVSGQCFALRRELFEAFLPESGDDVVAPLSIIRQGRRIAFAETARVYESRISDAGAELRARTRMTLRGITGVLRFRELLNPLRYPGVALALWSHRLLRWLSPFAFLLALTANLPLLGRRFYRLTFLTQLVVYAAAGAGYLAERRQHRLPVASSLGAFALANLAMLRGVLQAARGRRMIAFRSEG